MSRREVPLVTIGITCFNAENTIGQAIECAAAQDWPRLEIIVVDDGSSDRSLEIVREMAETDRRIRAIQHDQNRGYAGALNTVINEAAGEYIAIFDDDDFSVPDRISKQEKRLIEYVREHNTNLVFCYSNRDVVEQDGSFSAPTMAIGRKPVEPSGDAVADFLLWHREDPDHVWGQFGSCTLFASKRTLIEVGPLDEEFRRSAEWDLAIRLALMGGHFVAVDEPLITQFKTSTVDKSGMIPLVYSLKLREKYKDYLKSKEVYLASIAIAHARFQYFRGRSALSRIYVALACICSPRSVLPNELAKRRRRKPTTA
jgi:glycosyltransferase involved in cell wall biosynthesis